MTEQTNTPPARLPYHDSFRWLDGNGFEHITSISAPDWDTLAYLIGEAEGGIVNSNGKALISVNLRPTNEPAAPAPQPAKIQEHDENGTPVVTPDGKPVMVDLPDGTRIFSIKEIFHDTNQDGTKHMLKVVLNERYDHGNGKYGINCFHADDVYPGWRNWQKGQRFAPSPDAAKVIVRDPEPGKKWANIVKFLPA